MNTSLTVTTHKGARLPFALIEDTGRQALWGIDRKLWSPETLTVVNPASEILGALLTSGRPYSAYRKIVDIVATDLDVFALILHEAQKSLTESVADPVADDHATSAARKANRAPQPLVIHLEERPAFAAFSTEQISALEQAGFVLQPQPVPSIPSTRLDDTSGVRVWSWWRNTTPSRTVSYYGQTTEVTCGAVSALAALQHMGLEQFTPDSLISNREVELAFWRRATNLPAIDPLGLATQTALSVNASDSPRSLPKVIMSTSGFVLLEDYVAQPSEIMLRTDLQTESLRQAEQLGIPIENRWVDADEIAEFIEQGSFVFLLISLNALIGDPSPHWVLAYDVVDSHILVSDPWVQYPNGETWADTYALPLPIETIDLITRWGDPEYRAVIVLEVESML